MIQKAAGEGRRAIGVRILPIVWEFREDFEGEFEEYKRKKADYEEYLAEQEPTAAAEREEKANRQTRTS